MDFPEMDVAVTLTGREWYCVMKMLIRQDQPWRRSRSDEVLKNIALAAVTKIADQVRAASQADFAVKQANGQKAAFAAKCREGK
jgi:hypothetical protein